MKKNKLQLILSILFIFIICLATLPLCMGCKDEDIVEVEEGQSGWIWGEDVVFMGIIVGAILAADKEIKEKKVGQDTVEDEINLRIQFLQAIMVSNNVQNISKAGEKILSDEADKTIKLSADDTENQDSENQNASETTVPQAQETTQTTEEETTQTTEEETTQTTEEETTQTTEEEKPTGTITLIMDFGCGGVMIINFDAGAVTGSYYCTSELEDGEIGVGTGAFSGSIDIDTGAITASGSGDYTAYEEIETFPITLVGTLSSDHASATGTMTNKWGEVPWTGAAK